MLYSKLGPNFSGYKAWVMDQLIRCWCQPQNPAETLEQGGICSTRLFCNTPQTGWNLLSLPTKNIQCCWLSSSIQCCFSHIPAVPVRWLHEVQMAAGLACSSPPHWSLPSTTRDTDPPSEANLHLHSVCTSSCSRFVAYGWKQPTLLMIVQETLLRIKPELQRVGFF